MSKQNSRNSILSHLLGYQVEVEWSENAINGVWVQLTTGHKLLVAHPEFDAAHQAAWELEDFIGTRNLHWDDRI